jgi:ABC-type microcin C transport system duplicated ATPase subunit YejF
MPPAKIEGGEAIFHDNGRDVDLLQLSGDDVRQIRGGKIGFIFQDALSALNPVMSVGDQISESLIEHLGMGGKEAEARTIELLTHVGIPGAKQRHKNYPHQFSGGMRQRVMIAVAIACNPKIVIADEPTTALDVTVQAQIVELVKSIQEELGMAVIWITHDLGVVAGNPLKSRRLTICTNIPSTHTRSVCWALCLAWTRLERNAWSASLAPPQTCLRSLSTASIPGAVHMFLTVAGKRFLTM